MASADIAAALSTTMRLRSRTVATTAKRPTPQPRKSIDSYMFEAGMRPGDLPAHRDAPGHDREAGEEQRARGEVEARGGPWPWPRSTAASERVSTHHAMRVGRARL